VIYRHIDSRVLLFPSRDAHKLPGLPPENHKTTKHLDIWGIHVGIQNRRAIVLADGKHPGYLTLTTVEDVANVVARAVEYEGMWPEVGGIRGDEVSMSALIEKGESVRGRDTILFNTENPGLLIRFTKPV
jgi:hypothetical protein